jgi:hypothetical protein
MKSNWLSNWLIRLGVKKNAGSIDPIPSTPDPDLLKGMVRAVLNTRPDEIGCGECFEQVDRFADMVLAGKDAAEALPLVQDHLNRCDDCREEFEALLTALRSVAH